MFTLAAITFTALMAIKYLKETVDVKSREGQILMEQENTTSQDSSSSYDALNILAGMGICAGFLICVCCVAPVLLYLNRRFFSNPANVSVYRSLHSEPAFFSVSTTFASSVLAAPSVPAAPVAGMERPASVQLLAP